MSCIDKVARDSGHKRSIDDDRANIDKLGFDKVRILKIDTVLLHLAMATLVTTPVQAKTVYLVYDSTDCMARQDWPSYL